MTLCGAINTQGNHLDLKITFLSLFKIIKPNEMSVSLGLNKAELLLKLS
jgi:hypothetical protein